MFKVRQEFLKKIPCFSKKTPHLKTIDFTNSVFFPKKIPCFTKFPGFHSFKSLKTLEKLSVLYKKHMFTCQKLYIYLLKTFTKDKGLVCV